MMGSGKRGPIKEKDEENAHYLDPQKQEIERSGRRQIGKRNCRMNDDEDEGRKKIIVMEKIVASFFLVIKVVFLVTLICDRYQIAPPSKVAHVFATVEI
ncbi:hypothetical protein Csa_022732 [Cucumis sativus]|uniref:Uncharacterized protein n=1 Tax=Cucumis sativus TaxID=3659 RepID=A0A0A0LTC1_CUCSA|nr:hypothetical protein Csa_022732 [Cucumis sativus]